MSCEIKLKELTNLIETHPGSTLSIAAKIEQIVQMLKDGIFYAPMSSKEMKQVLVAMTREFKMRKKSIK
jgi:predicted nuclease with RNAse H fold